ncbi:MAG: hypothetical protein ACK2UW_21905 [Anaerolineales bacterium]
MLEEARGEKTLPIIAQMFYNPTDKLVILAAKTQPEIIPVAGKTEMRA